MWVGSGFFRWKLKHTEQRLGSRNRRQKHLFGGPLPLLSPMLRVDCAILNGAFERVGTANIPKHKPGIAQEASLHSLAGVKAAELIGIVSQDSQEGIDVERGWAAFSGWVLIRRQKAVYVSATSRPKCQPGKES